MLFYNENFLTAIASDVVALATLTSDAFLIRHIIIYYSNTGLNCGGQWFHVGIGIQHKRLKQFLQISGEEI